MLVSSKTTNFAKFSPCRKGVKISVLSASKGDL